MTLDGDTVEAYDKEALVKRNPHVDFPAVEASRPDYDGLRSWIPSKTPNPKWQPGDGASRSGWEQHRMIAIDPDSHDRTVNQNYKLMISSTVPRPIALVSTVSADGLCRNLAPFSYFNNVSNDPPLYSLAFHGAEANDSLRNLLETGECCISIVSDWFLEAANFTSVNSPPKISEWELSGLHPKASDIVKVSYVGEAAVSMECQLHSTQTIWSKTVVDDDGKPIRTATLVLVEAVMFHVREDAIDEKRETVDTKVLRPVWRGGGIMYGTCFDGWETPRPDAFRVLRGTQRVLEILATSSHVSNGVKDTNDYQEIE
ncbi:flavo protein-like protein oxygenase [Mollisia scopiformis]|uniref:Flavo protein-like protein oxygenase n=1 Tax=Mollisia scopiformis TaxID=149040 RepID=A0A194X8F0_MOLSC|nr:flavo protein-like protein oxygenase [Mollisia scopiformis]KUJ16067.1 flavo protein-like protein oxygenase [Mollisia scopiformis]